MSHALKMVVGCVLPLLLLFLLPLFGIGEGVALFVAVVLMFACHLLMIRGQEHQSDNQSDEGDRYAQP